MFVTLTRYNPLSAAVMLERVRFILLVLILIIFLSLDHSTSAAGAPGSMVMGITRSVGEFVSNVMLYCIVDITGDNISGGTVC